MTARYQLSPILRALGACSDAQRRIAAEQHQTFAEAWSACQRGDWLLWLAARAGVDRRAIVLAACDCAEPALVHVPAYEDRPRVAIETARRWARGEATIEEVRRAAAAAAAAANAAAAASYAYAASYAAADAAAAAADAYAASYAAADAARSTSLARSADLVRARIMCSEVEWLLVERGRELGALVEVSRAR